jgi:Ca-activated chloride channel family protein
MINKSIALALLLVALGLSVEAQQPAFKAGVEVVTVPVTVTSRDRNTFIVGLTPAEFKISENGERQDITVVTRERVPVSIAIAVDASPVMVVGNRRQLAEAAVGKLVASLQPDDEIAILFISRTVEEKLPWTRVREIKALNWGGWNPESSPNAVNAGLAALNDGLRAALDRIERANNPRRAVLVVSAGFESSSRMSIAGMVKTRQQSETSVFGIGLGSSDPRVVAAEQPRRATAILGGEDPGAQRQTDILPGLDVGAPGSLPPQSLPEFDYLETIVGDSGGMVRRVLSENEAATAAKNVAEELQNQYLVGYTPKKPFDGKYRKLKIEVNRKGLYVRHREGYLALGNAP